MAVQDAVFDFFQTYLVDDKPEVSLAYISVKALPCVAEFGTGEKATDGLVRLRIYRNMKNVSDRYGKLTSLDQVMQGVVMFPPGALPVTQQHGNLFAIAQLPDDVALKLDCRARQKLALAEDLPRATHRTGQYYGVSTILWNKDHSRGQVLTSVWSKEATAWKMVSWQIGDPFGKATGPQVAEPEPEPKRRPNLPSANPALLRSVTGLLSDWLIKDEYNVATTYFAKESLGCTSTEAKKSPAASGGTATLKSWLKEVGKSSGKGTSLDQIIETVPYGHPHMQAVPQPYRSEFLLARIGDDLAAMGSCASKSSGSAINKTVGVSPPTFDADVFRVAFGFRQRRGATVTLDFARRDGTWKVVAFDTVAD